MGTLIRSHGWQKTNSPAMQMMTAVLSNGTTRVVGVLDPNQTGVTGDGGDNTGVPKFYIYSSADGNTWTLRATSTVSVWSANGRPMGSMTVDSADNVHFCYRDTSGAVKYIRYTFGAGPTYTPVTEVTAISAPAANESFVRLDITAIGTTNRVAVAAFHNRLIATEAARMYVAINNVSNVFTTVVNEIIMSGAGMSRMTYCDDFSIAGDQTAVAGDNLTTICIAYQRRATNGTDLGDLVKVYKVNISTLALVGSYTPTNVPFNKDLGSGWRVYRCYWTAADTWVVTATIGNYPWRGWIYKFSYNRSTNAFTQIIAPSLSNDLYPQQSVSKIYTTNGQQSTVNYNGMDRSYDPINWAAQAYVTDRVVFLAHNYVYSFAVVCKLNSDGTVTWYPWRHWDGTYNVSPGVPPAQIWAGTPRNYSSRVLPVVISYVNLGGGNAYRLEYREKKIPQPPVVLNPNTGGTVTTDLPTVTGQFKMSENDPQTRVKFEYQFATDAGFTTNFRTVTESDADYVLPLKTASPTNAVVTSQETIPAIAELFQGSWYVRAREIDELGDIGSFGASKTFTVSHPPVGANLYPSNEALFVYGSGDITFSWIFTDPSPIDYQTAYRIVVERNDTGSAVADTGKISSSLQNGVATITSGFKDLPLRWKLTLWDSDDVVGPESSPALFSITDGPAPAIIAPTNASTITNAIPVITWTTGLSSNKYQVAYRVVITLASSIVYTTGWITSSTLTHQVPVGYLKTGNTYTIAVYIRDNYSLEGVGTSSVTTSWTPPASRTLGGVFLSEYAKRGFVWLTFDPAGFDTDFAGFNVYRRQYGESGWTLVETSTKLTDIVGIPDYLAGSGVTYEYAMTQVVDRFGDLIESTIVDSAKVTVKPKAEGYWLLDVLSPEDSLPLYNVTGEDFTEEYEQETFHVIGRGRHVDYGDRLGYSGTLTAQLRDKYINGAQRVNYTSNPSMSYISPGPTPYNWTMTSAGTVGTIIEELVTTRDPLPTGKRNCYRISASNLGTAITDQIMASQVIILDSAIAVGDTCTFSIWVNDVDGNISGRNLEIAIRWETAGGTLVTEAVATPPTSVEFYTSSGPGSPDYLNSAATPGHWERYSISGARPATATQARVRIQLEGTGSGSAGARTLVVCGAQFEKGSMTSYFDGNQLGCNWIGVKEIGTSETSGFYTARGQRLDIETMKEKRQSIYLRSPFGDIWLVATGNIGSTRVPGTGQTEFTNVSIPYQEVAF